MTISGESLNRDVLAAATISDFFAEGDIDRIFFGQLLLAVSGRYGDEDVTLKSVCKPPMVALNDAIGLAAFLCRDGVFAYGHSERWNDDSFHYIEGISQEEFASLGLQQYEQNADRDDVDLFFRTWLIKREKGRSPPVHIPEKIALLFAPSSDSS